ncbi:hypothetical protein RM780_21195 [Streptomyces sp. DSM 44917]|uniref:Putative T7SS secretion signal domain-containing protein n=1 Tax=Streptomyces boetiae TaxID=3075541 RepID=A0ABU2LDV0_9ACTN|nr:hypothetical protein [Streptomyces sp. DSM 44917]MDT0309457.1 hypothetical protein [Streptomyces sp. DSM 44917]
MDLDRDPTPGEPEEIRELSEELQEFADDVGEALGRIRGMASDRAVLEWAGLSAEAFRSEFEDVPGNLTKLQRSYDMAADALARYWPELQTAQGMADRALQRAIDAQAALSSAQTNLADAQDWFSRAGDEAERLREEGERENNAHPPDETEVRQAVRDHQAAREAASAAQTRVDNAQADLSAARELARQALDMREEAARTCAQGIEEASDAGIHNRRWWERAVDWVVDNWDTIVSVCQAIVAVLGIVVMIIGGPLAWVVLAAALVVLADTLIRYSRGQCGLLDVAFAALDCIPGGRGLTTLGGLAAGFRGLARGGLREMADGLRRGADDIVPPGRQTGGEIRPTRGEDDFDSEWADEAYDSIRATDDVDDIAANVAEYGFTRDEIAQIRSHVFEEEHLLDSYVDYGVPAEMARFESNPRIAEAWLRLREGNPHPEDITLLRHELHESNYMRDTGNPSYSEAHRATIDAGLAWDGEAPSREGIGFQRRR